MKGIGHHQAVELAVEARTAKGLTEPNNLQSQLLYKQRMAKKQQLLGLIAIECDSPREIP